MKMKMSAYRFRKLAGWERIDRWCRLASMAEDRTLQICGRLAVIEFEGIRPARRGQEKAVRIDYCQTHGEHVASLYGARIGAPDEAPPSPIPTEAHR